MCRYVSIPGSVSDLLHQFGRLTLKVGGVSETEVQASANEVDLIPNAHIYGKRTCDHQMVHLKEPPDRPVEREFKIAPVVHESTNEQVRAILGFARIGTFYVSQRNPRTQTRRRASPHAGDEAEAAQAG